VLAARTSAPSELVTDAALANGEHTIGVEAIDADGNTAMQERTITVAPVARIDDDDDDAPDTQVGGCSATAQSPFTLIVIVVGVLRRRRGTRRDPVRAVSRGDTKTRAAPAIA
jgi:hypothetical protein